MYTILLATDQPGVRDNFKSYTHWDEHGYTAPLIFDNASDAVSALGRETVHAVGIQLPASQSAALYDRLHGMHMLFLEPVSDHAALDEVLRRMTSMIEKQAEPRADEQMLKTLRDTFFQSLLDGLMHSETVLRNRLMVLSLPVRADARCRIITLHMSNADQYMREVWAYGRARLAIQVESNGIYYTLSELRAGEARLLACPTRAMSDEEMEALSAAHVREQINRVCEFLELELTAESSRELPGLMALLRTPPASPPPR